MMQRSFEPYDPPLPIKLFLLAAGFVFFTVLLSVIGDWFRDFFAHFAQWMRCSG